MRLGFVMFWETLVESHVVVLVLGEEDSELLVDRQTLPFGSSIEIQLKD